MEPVSIEPKEQKGKGRKGSLENPEVYENVPGHVIPIIEREFDDFDNEAEKFLDGRDPRGRVHRLPPEAGRLRPAPGRRPDVPHQAAHGRRHAGADGDVRRRGGGVRAPQQGPHHDAPEHPDPPHPAARDGRADPQGLRLRPVLARGLRQHRPQRDRRPVGRHHRGRALRHHPVRGRVRALLRAPPHDAADAAQGQDRVHRDRRGPRDHRHPRHRLHPARPRRRARRRDPGRRRHLDHAPRRPDALRVRRARQRRLPEGLRGGLPHLRPPGLAARQPRAGAHQGADRQDRHRRVPRAGRGGARRATGSPSATSIPTPLLLEHDEEANAPQPLAHYAQPNGDGTGFERFRASNVEPQRQEGFSSVQVRVVRGDLTPEQFRGLAQIMRDYSGGYARTTVEQNLVLRWVRDESVYEVWSALERAGPRRRRRRSDRRHGLVPRHRLAASSASPARWASTAP